MDSPAILKWQKLFTVSIKRDISRAVALPWFCPFKWRILPRHPFPSKVFNKNQSQTVCPFRRACGKFFGTTNPLTTNHQQHSPQSTLHSLSSLPAGPTNLLTLPHQGEALMRLQYFLCCVVGTLLLVDMLATRVKVLVACSSRCCLYLRIDSCLLCAHVIRKITFQETPYHFISYTGLLFKPLA